MSTDIETVLIIWQCVAVFLGAMATVGWVTVLFYWVRNQALEYDLKDVREELSGLTKGN